MAARRSQNFQLTRIAVGKDRTLAAWFGLLAVSVLLSGCLGGGSLYTVVGTVTEADAGVPLWGAVVSIGSKSTTTDAFGQYELREVPGGVQQLRVSLEGYESVARNLDLRSDRSVDIGLASQLPPMGENALLLFDHNDNSIWDGDTVERPRLVFEARYDRMFDLDQVKIGYVEFIVNGHPVPIEDSSARELFYGEMALMGGQNTFQIRVYDSEGNARTTELITINVATQPLDLRLILTWDKEADFDLHMFKRQDTEPNRFELDSDDRHVYWANSWPWDFSEGCRYRQNPYLDLYDSTSMRLEALYLRELTPGDHHIWIHPYSLRRPTTTAILQLMLDGHEPTPEEYYLQEIIDQSQEKDAVYIITLRVHEDGSKDLIWIEPEQ